MAYYAMVVVVSAESFDTAYEGVVQRIAGVHDVRFVGEPWEVKPIGHVPDLIEYEGDEPEFGTLECFDQHPER